MACTTSQATPHSMYVHAGTANANHLTGIYTLFSDMGGQPQFWALVANFLRK